MNIFAIVILTALVLQFLIGLAANLLNLKGLKFDLPPVLRGVYEPEDYRKSQEYLRFTTHVGLIESSFTLSILLAFWFSGGFNWLDQVVRTWGFIPLVNGLFYIGILLAGYSVFQLPFSIYDTFVIEAQFGFNRTTPGTFIFDKVKGAFLALLLGGAILAAILVLFQYVGIIAWFYCWAAVVIFSLIMQYALPTLIMPLFNKFTPLAPGELKEAIMKYARSVNFPIKNVFVMNGSKRSSKSNAFFTGFGQNKRIVLFDTLIAQHTIPEMIAILAHEVGHYKKKHIPQGLAISIIHTGLVFYLLSIFLGNHGLYQAFDLKEESIYAGLLFFGLLYTPLEMILSIVLQVISRKQEAQADRFAAQTIKEPNTLIEALKKLSSNNLSNLTPHPFYVFISYSHPPLLQRIQAIQSIKPKIESPHPEH
jgi:STE24 endopeptidase